MSAPVPLFRPSLQAAKPGNLGMASPDSSLQNSIGPSGLGQDLLPVDMTASGALQVSPAIPMLDLRSTERLPEIVDAPPPPPPPEPSRKPGELWLDGDVIMCACPDCRAPMSVRLWLMAAECWRCETAIELNEDQEREALRLLAERKAKEQAKAAAVSPPVAPPPPPRPIAQPAPPARTTLPVPPPAPKPAPAATVPPPVRTPPPAPKAPALQSPPPLPVTASMSAIPAPPLAPTPPPVTGQRFKGAPPPPTAQPARRPAAARRRVTKPFGVGDILKMTPAWLVSMLMHLFAITLLALLTREQREEDGPFITLSATMNPHMKDGGEKGPLVITPEAKFDLPLPNKADLKDAKTRDALVKANQDALELRLDDAPAAPLPDLERVKANIGSREGTSFNFAARDPRLRVELVSMEGGTTQTEAAVARGLRWLSQHQDDDGAWSLNGFRRAGKCNCGGEGHVSGKSPGTALALLPFLGAGQTHLVGRYKGHVSKGLRWLVQNQGKDGDLRAGATENAGMYTQGQAAIVLCEAFAMTGDEQLRVPAQKAIDFICKAQYRDGGWRYNTGPRDQAGDTSVVGWQLMALQSAKAANLTVPEETLPQATSFLNRVQSQGGSRYAYMAGHSPTHVMTAEALLCRMYLGWTREQKSLLAGAKFLTEHLPSDRAPNIYYWYYGTQTMHHLGGADWERWNLKMRDVLTSSQETGGGHQAGSWDPRGEHVSPGGRIYMTSLAVCTLEVYYRHLPIFRQIELDRKD